MAAKRKNLWSDESGAAMVEFTAAALTFFLLVFGSVEFANAYYQWNAATKAVQWGARVAAVSEPVANNLKTFTGVENGTLPGVILASGAYDCTCSGATGACTGTMPAGALGCYYLAAPMQRIVYGAEGRTTCVASTSDRDIGMCHLFPRILLSKVVVRYQYTGLGYAGRPGGAVPTITVSLGGTPKLQFEFILIGGLMNAAGAAFPAAIDMPSFATTVTGEDLTAQGT